MPLPSGMQLRLWSIGPEGGVLAGRSRDGHRRLLLPQRAASGGGDHEGQVQVGAGVRTVAGVEEVGAGGAAGAGMGATVRWGGGVCGWDVGVQGVSMAQSRAGRAPLSTAPTRCAPGFYAIQDSSLEYGAAWVRGWEGRRREARPRA